MNQRKLKAKCVEEGINIETLAEKIGVDKSTFYRRLNQGEFTNLQIKAIKEVLSLSEEEMVVIFFDDGVANMR